jgi:hypothetical protein
MVRLKLGCSAVAAGCKVKIGVLIDSSPVQRPRHGLLRRLGMTAFAVVLENLTLTLVFEAAYVSPSDKACCYTWEYTDVRL